MKQIAANVVIGLALSLAIIYYLELSSLGAITLVIFVCAGLVAWLMSLAGKFRKKDKEGV